MADDIRRSPQTVALLSRLLEDATAWHYGYDLSRQTALKSGTLYPILMRLSERCWLETKWEFADTGKPRHMYRLTSAGRQRARDFVLVKEESKRFLKPELAR